MSCLINAGLARDCGFGFGGMKKLWLNSESAVTGFTKSGGTLITEVKLKAAATDFQEYQFENNTGQFIEELQTGSASRFVNQTINAQFANITHAKRRVLEQLANAFVEAIVQDQADRYWYVGETGRGLLATVLSVDTGTAEADAAAATLTLVGGSLGYANEVTAAAVAAVIAA